MRLSNSCVIRVRVVGVGVGVLGVAGVHGWLWRRRRPHGVPVVEVAVQPSLVLSGRSRAPAGGLAIIEDPDDAGRAVVTLGQGVDEGVIGGAGVDDTQRQIHLERSLAVQVQGAGHPVGVRGTAVRVVDDPVVLAHLVPVMSVVIMYIIEAIHHFA